MFSLSAFTRYHYIIVLLKIIKNVIMIQTSGRNLNKLPKLK